MRIRTFLFRWTQAASLRVYALCVGGVLLSGCPKTPCGDGSLAESAEMCPDEQPAIDSGASPEIDSGVSADAGPSRESDGGGASDAGPSGCSQECTEGVCLNGTCTTGCQVAGVFLESGAVNPQNPCEFCDPALSSSAYSKRVDGTPCDDSAVCTTGEVCAAGVCQGGSLLNCDDANPCTTDSCGPQGCAHVAHSLACDDGDACTFGDVCSMGQCLGATPVSCDDANPCTADSCTAQGCTQMPAPDGTACPLGVCVGGSCSASCFIGGAVVPTGAVDPLDPCDVCIPSTSISGYTPRANGTLCDDSNACTAQSSCFAGACIGGAAINCDDGAACTYDSCNPNSGCVHTPASNGVSCGTNFFCVSGLCTQGCFIAGTFFNQGAFNPANSCQRCDLTLSSTQWSTVANGTACSTPSGTGTCKNGTCF